MKKLKLKLYALWLIGILLITLDWSAPLIFDFKVNILSIVLNALLIYYPIYVWYGKILDLEMAIFNEKNKINETKDS